MTPLTKVLQVLRERGYEDDFNFNNGSMHSAKTGKKIIPPDLVIERVYRFEGDSNPDDMAVLYGARISGGTKGVIIDAYGPYDNDDLAEFLKNVKIEEVNDD